MANKHAQPSSKHSVVCSSCEQEIPSYYSLQQLWRKDHGVKQRKPSDTVSGFEEDCGGRRGRWRETQSEAKWLSSFCYDYRNGKWEK